MFSKESEAIGLWEITSRVNLTLFKLSQVVKMSQGAEIRVLDLFPSGYVHWYCGSFQIFIKYWQSDIPIFSLWVDWLHCRFFDAKKTTCVNSVELNTS